jgi:hypothetical protein
MAADYLTLAELKAALAMSSETYADPEMTQAITAASRAVDDFCGRFFYKDSSDVTRKYTPVARDFAYIDDLSAAPTSVANQGTTLVLGTDYVLDPANALLDGGPYDTLRSATGVDLFAQGTPDSVVVVGKFGWPAVPPEVKSSATILAARLTRRIREAAFGFIGIGFDGGAARIPITDPDLRMLLSPFVRRASVRPT